jgi:hypothetical protein
MSTGQGERVGRCGPIWSVTRVLSGRPEMWLRSSFINSSDISILFETFSSKNISLWQAVRYEVICCAQSIQSYLTAHMIYGKNQIESHNLEYTL